MKRANKFTPTWDIYSLGIIFLFLIIQAMRWQLFPLFIDVYYHLSVMLGFNIAGGYVLNSFWEFAPVGRPHLYPPLLHIWMLILYKTGFSAITIAKFFDVIAFPITLFFLWLFVKNIFNKRLACFTVLAAASVFPFYLSLLTRLPASLSIIFALTSFLCIEKGKKTAAAIFLIYAFYLHALMPWIIVLSFLLYGIIDRGKLKACLVTILIAVLAYIPFLAHLYANRQYFSVVNVAENNQLEINIAVIVFAIIGIAAAFKRKGRYRFLLCLFTAFLVLGALYRYRYFSGQGLFGFILLAAVGIDYFYEKITSNKALVYYIASVVILFFILSPTVDISPKGANFKAFNSTLGNLTSEKSYFERGNATSILFPKSYNQIVSAIKENTKEGDIIYSNFEHVAGILSIFSGRPTSTAMLAEVRPKREFDPIEAATLVIWIKDPDNIKDEPSRLINEYGLQKIKDTEMAFIYRNARASAKAVVCKPFVPNKALFLIFFISLCLVVFDFVKNKPN